MYLKLIQLIAILLLATGLVYLGVSWADRGHRIAELEQSAKWQEARYTHLVDRARQVQETLGRQQAETRDWQTKYSTLATRGPEIRERTRTVVERIPEYIDVEVRNQRAEEALFGLASFVSEQLAPMVDGGER